MSKPRLVTNKSLWTTARARLPTVMVTKVTFCDVLDLVHYSLEITGEAAAMSGGSQTPAILPVSCSFSSISLGEDIPMCRICHNTGGKQQGQEPLHKACWCKGSMGDVHRSCLETWLSAVYSDRCPICHYNFRTKRVFKPIAKVLCKAVMYYPTFLHLLT